MLKKLLKANKYYVKKIQRKETGSLKCNYQMLWCMLCKTNVLYTMWLRSLQTEQTALQRIIINGILNNYRRGRTSQSYRITDAIAASDSGDQIWYDKFQCLQRPNNLIFRSRLSGRKLNRLIMAKCKQVFSLSGTDFTESTYCNHSEMVLPVIKFVK